MATLKTLTKGIKLTANEKQVLNLLNEDLKDHFGEGYSSTDCNDVAKELEIEVASVKGIVGSLVKKNLLTTWDTGTGFEVISFVDQEEMVYERFMKPTTPISKDEEAGLENPAVFGKHNPNFKEDYEKSKKETIKKTSKTVKAAKEKVTEVAADPVKAVKKVFRKYNTIEDVVKVIKENKVKNLSELNAKYYGAYDAIARNGWKAQILEMNVLVGKGKK